MSSPFATKQEPGRYTGDGVRCTLCGVTRMRAEEIHGKTCADFAWCLANREKRPGPRAGALLVWPDEATLGKIRAEEEALVKGGGE